MIAADFVTAGWFVVAWLCALIVVLAVDAIGKIVRATRDARGDRLRPVRPGTQQHAALIAHRISRRQSGGGRTSKGVPKQ